MQLSGSGHEGIIIRMSRKPMVSKALVVWKEYVNQQGATGDERGGME